MKAILMTLTFLILAPLSIFGMWVLIALAPLLFLVATFTLGIWTFIEHDYPLTLFTAPVLLTKPQLNVLVVDDDEASITPLCHFLKAEGASVTYVPNGQSFIEEMLSQKPFDLVFMDSWMPEIDGEKALLAVDPILTNRQQNLPVIFYTNNKDLEVYENFEHFKVFGLWSKKDISTLPKKLHQILRNLFPEYSLTY